jgi:DNA-binding NarL/FixJ family response regulator
MKVIIYEDDSNLLQYLSMLIDGEENFTVVGGFHNCQNVVKEVSSLKPDAVLMDIDMPEVNGIEGVKKIKENYPLVKVVMHTVFDDDDKLFSSLKAGANGYLLKRASPREIIEALEKVVYEGYPPMSPGIALKLVDYFHKLKKTKNNYRLTEREKVVLKLLVEGHTYKSIASELHIGIHTVTKHLQNIYRKLHVNSAPQAVVKAIQEGLS